METIYCQVFEKDVHDVPVPAYTEEEHGTWALLIEKQKGLINGRACKEFIQGLKDIQFSEDRIPLLAKVSDTIQSHTGWTLMRVDGLVHPKDFFNLLSRKIFPSTDFIRKRNELMYTPAPDMFHDLFGHAPLLTSHDFTEFFETFGHVGVNAYKKYPEDHEVQLMLTRIYWFTVEFGLIKTSDGIRAYGSGSVSSPQELEFCVSNHCRHHPFIIEKVAQQNYDIWHLQEDVFVIDSFIELGKSFRAWAKKFSLL